MSTRSEPHVELLHAPSNDAELAQALAVLPNLECSPQAALLLACAKHHLTRQQWVADVITTALRVPVESLQAGAFSRPDDVPTEGEVPGHVGWTYEFHGQGCCLTHEDGTTLDVDFPEGRIDSIDPYFYSGYLETATELPTVESELRGRYPDDNAWMFDVDELRSLGWVAGNHAFTMTPAGHEAAAPLVKHLLLVDGGGNAYSRAFSASALGQFRLAACMLADEQAPKSVQILQTADARTTAERTATLLRSARKRVDSDLRELLRALVAVSGKPSHHAASR